MHLRHRRLRPTPSPARRARGRAPSHGLLTVAMVGLLASGCTLAAGPASLAELLPAMQPAAVSPSPSSGTDPDRGQARGEGRATRRAFTLDLYRPGDFVAQYDASWCVGASMQMMANMIEPGRPDRTRATQLRLYRTARRVSPWVETRPGASVYGWSEGLERLGYGGYEELAATSRAGALRLAARQMRLTGRPVGLLVWGGAHAWVMSGFRATADPALTDDFEVTHIWVEDPWYGRISRTWGRGLEPHTLVTAKQLGDDFVRYASPYRPQYGRKGQFVVVAPV